MDARKYCGVLENRLRNIRLRCEASQKPLSTAIIAIDLPVFSSMCRASESRISMNAERGEIPSASLKCRSRDRLPTFRCLAISATESGASRFCCISARDVDDRTALQVDDNRAVAPRSPPAPIIYANNPNPGVAMSERGIPLQLPQDRVVADRHAEPPHQALAGTAAGAMTEQTENLRDPPCPARIRGGNRRQRVGECLSFTFLMRAPPAAQPKLHRYGLPWTGRSWRLRSVRRPQSGQMPKAGAAAETTQPSSSVNATPRTIAPEPGDHFIFVRIPGYGGIMSNGA